MIRSQLELRVSGCVVGYSSITGIVEELPVIQITHKATNPAWKSKPTWYMVASEDRSINPEQERMMAKRANAKTVEVNSSHVAYMSHPKETAKLIEEAATSHGN
jgi:hypothetical protein